MQEVLCNDKILTFRIFQEFNFFEITILLQIEHDKAFVRRRFSNFKFSAVAGVEAQEGLGDESELDMLKGSIFSDFVQIEKYCKFDF